MFFAGKRPTNLGVSEGKLAPVKSSPNAVSSQTDKASHRIEPFQFDGDVAENMVRLQTVVESFPGHQVIESDERYIYAECKTPIMGYVDDLEFYWDDASQQCHVRSASRLGYSDLGKNRKRVEAIRERFHNLAG